MPVEFITKSAENARYELEQFENGLLELMEMFGIAIEDQKAIISDLEKNKNTDPEHLKDETDRLEKIQITLSNLTKDLDKFKEFKLEKNVEFFTLSNVPTNYAKFLYKIINSTLESDMLDPNDRKLLTNLMQYVVEPYLNGQKTNYPILPSEKKIITEIINRTENDIKSTRIECKEFLENTEKIKSLLDTEINNFKSLEKKYLQDLRGKIENLIKDNSKVPDTLAPDTLKFLSNKLQVLIEKDIKRIEKYSNKLSFNFKILINKICENISIKPIFKETELRNNLVNQFKAELQKLNASKPKDSLGGTLASTSPKNETKLR